MVIATPRTWTQHGGATAPPPGGASPAAPAGTPGSVGTQRLKPARYRRVDVDLGAATSQNGTELWPKGSAFTSISVRILPAAAAGFVGLRIGGHNADAVLLDQPGDSFTGFVENGGLYLSNAPVGLPDGPALPYPVGTVLVLIIGLGGTFVQVAA